MDEKNMRSPEELVAAAREAIAEDEYDDVMDALQEAIGHLSDFSWKTGVKWDADTVRECCHEIGELIYRDAGMRGMQFVHEGIYYRMRGIAARYLEHFWNGCGDGEWRA